MGAMKRYLQEVAEAMATDLEPEITPHVEQVAERLLAMGYLPPWAKGRPPLDDKGDDNGRIISDRDS
jgi:hypothetical protein